MDGFNQLKNWLVKAWGTATVSGRIVSVLAATLMLVTIVGAAIWSAMPDYKLLRDGISPVVTAEIVSALTSAGIPNQMNYSGTGVSVPASRWNEANITISNLNLAGSDPGSPPIDSIFPTRPGHSDAVRAKEMGLERSLESLRAVKSADVHLAIPETSPFRSKRQAPSASVIVEAHSNQTISNEMAMSIIHTVAAAVEGLDPKNVTLTDADGSMVGNGAHGDPATQRRDYVSQLEASLAMKAQDLLAPILGPDRAVVRVTAQVDDFLDKVTTKQLINAADKVRITEKITSSDQKGAVAGSLGVAGTGSNNDAPLSPGLASNQPVSGKSETNETSYDYPRETEEVHEIGGQIVRLSISATVDATVQPAGTDPATGDAQPAGGTILTQEEIEGIIKNAVGFSDVRGDQLEVVMTQFSAVATTSPADSVPMSQQWEFVSQLARNASLGLAAIVALLLGMMILKKIKPIEIAASHESGQRREILSQLSNRVDDNPEAVSKILAAWIGQQADGDAADTMPMKKAA